jgi:hypothetical protein
MEEGAEAMTALLWLAVGCLFLALALSYDKTYGIFDRRKKP